MDAKKQNILPVTQADMQEQQACMDRIRQINDGYTLQNGRPRFAYVLTFGCQQNEADSEKIAGMCRQMGYRISDGPENCDLIVVNTCAIREHAEIKALSTIGQFKHLKEKNRELVIAVCGCMVSQSHRVEQIKKSYPYVDFVFGTASLHRFPELLGRKLSLGRRLFESDTATYALAEGIPVDRSHPFKAWVSIMYGCNNFCSYCIVPYVRGRERSRDRRAVYDEVADLVSRGYRDITLLGQNVNSYGKSEHMDYDFADLLKDLSGIPGDYRLRFMTSHPKDASDKLIDVMADHPHIARHFHLPLQSGSDRILKAMNRHYDLDRFLHCADYIRKRMPDCVLTSDIIVGFPGETDEDFERTLEALKLIRFDMLYSFIFSPRVGTPAASMPDPVPEDVKGARFRRLLEVQNEIALEKNREAVGSTLTVLCDGPSKENGSLMAGRTDGNKIVFFEGEPGDAGCFLDVRVDRADPYALYGTRI